MIPAGMTDGNIEFFAHNGKLYSLSGGVKYEWPDLPDEHISLLQSEMYRDKRAYKTLESFSEMDKIKVFGICRFGSCNSVPDFTGSCCTDGNEYYDCGLRTRCAFEGIRCSEVVTGNGVITARQLQIMRMVSTGMLDKEIAAGLDISENTVHNHIQNIFQKIGGNSRVDIATFVLRRNLI